MEPNRMLDRLQKLEREMIALRAELAPRRSWKNVLGKVGMFLVSYWVLMSFFAAIATATYVKFAFNIDYFESYRNAAAVKRLSEFHREMGDELFLRNDWKQALASYQAATAANPANTEAALGVVKCGVFMPEEDHQAYDPATAAAKLRRLRELYPNDPQVAFLEVIQMFNNGQTEGIIEKCDAVLAMHRTFAGGYLVKSYVQQGNGDFKGAATTLEALLKFDPDNGMADSNLGYCYLFTGQRDEALAHLERGATNYPTMVNSISLAEVCRSRGEVARTEAILNNVERVCNLPEMEKEYYVGGQWLWNYLPEHEGDVDSQRNSITCSTIEQKRAVLRISQGLLAAAKGDGETAGRRFDECLKLEPLYKGFLINKLRAAAHADELEDRIRTGLRNAAEAMEQAE